MKIYQAPIVKSILSFYGKLLFPDSKTTIYAHLSRLSQKMHDGLLHNEDCLYAQFNNYNPQYLGIPIATLRNSEFNLPDSQHTVAHEYGFDSWKQVENLKNTSYHIDFENAVNAIISGDIGTLKEIVDTTPDLVHMHSQYGHKASLLHYTANNGVEFWRQQVPHNLVEIIKYLIDSGADKKATMQVYGGEFTAYELFVTSAHPTAAGLSESDASILQT